MTPERQAVIYTAAREQQAQLLKNLLADAGIEAVVLNDALQGAVGDLPFGWTTAVRLAVRESDAEAARELAVQFDRLLAAGELDEATAGDLSVDHDDAAGIVDEANRWPRCPKCAGLRHTTCSICQTSGTDFEIGEGDAADEPGATANNPLAIISVSGRMLVICPTCDEPFVPRYLRRCEWCNHDFGDGTQLPTRRLLDNPLEINPRALALLAATLVVLAGLLFWFSRLFRIE